MSSFPAAGDVFFEARCEQSTFLKVPCENCGKHYVCSVAVCAQAREESTGTARGDHEAKKRAEAIAKAVLMDGLEKARPGLAPCPYCGWIQREMFDAARAELPTTMSNLGIFIMFLGVLMLLPVALMLSISPPAFADPTNAKSVAVVLWAATAGVMLLGCLLKVRADRRWRAYDPNSEPVESRLELAQRTSMRMEFYEKLLAGCALSITNPIANPKTSTAIEDIARKTGADGLFEPKTVDKTE